MKHFRPIGLCNMSYKIITKLISSRLRNALHYLVGPAQCAFIPTRQGQDNIIVAQEVFHSMRLRRGQKGWMALKIDLEKAYDRIRWEFILDTLEAIDMPSNLINIIWHAISSPKMRLLWNGEALEEFSPSRGIRQGDPISPYLFVLCLKRMFHLIEDKVHHKAWKPIKLANNGPLLTHLAFADDLLLFAEASSSQAMVIKDVLDRFCSSSGQKVSEEKTRIFFSRNVHWEHRREIRDILGYASTEDLGKYLGIPILHKRVNKDTFHFIIEKVNQRLSNWKAKNLSLAGRLTLAKSVIQALPTYAMQAASLPISVCEAVDKRCRSFVWGDSEDKHHIHLINWDTVCTPKKEGGLGLRPTRVVNQAFLLKNSWQLCTNTNKLWVSVMRNKYKCGTNPLPKINIFRPGTNLWRGICSIWPSFCQLIKWNIKDGNSVDFWTDSWIPGRGPLMEDLNINNVQLNIQSINLHPRKVSSMITNNGEWDSGKFANFIPENITRQIHLLPTPSQGNGADEVLWGPSSDGQFSSKTAFEAISSSPSVPHSKLFPCIWRWKGPERIRLLFWKAMHGRLMTNSERLRRHLASSSTCSICGSQEETLFHCFRDCPRVATIWFNMLHNNQSQTQFFSTTNWSQWLVDNISGSLKVNKSENWSLTFGVTCDTIWNARNNFIFNGVHDQAQSLICRVKTRVDKITAASARELLIHGVAVTVPSQTDPIWQAPSSPFVKLNCDASVTDCGLTVGCGGLLRDVTGTVLWSYTQNLNRCTVLEAELRAILQGVLIAKNRGVKYLIVETDCAPAVELLNGGAGRNLLHRALVSQIRCLLLPPAVVEWRFIPRAANGAADSIAKSCVSLSRSGASLSPSRVCNFMLEAVPHCASFIVKEEAGRVVTRTSP